jgi:hypothetical protein
MSVARQTVYQPGVSAAVPSKMPDQAAEGATRYTHTTRYLCAAAYSDSSFRDAVIRKALEEEHKAVAPSFGMDPALVVRHCLRARKKLAARDRWLIALAVFYLIAAAATNDPAVAITVGLLVWAGAFVICFAYKLRVLRILTEKFTRDKFNPDLEASVDDRDVAHLDESQNGNVVIYSGFSPFVGSGLNLGGWSFALDLRKSADGSEAAREDHASRKKAAGDDTAAPLPVEIAELYQRVSDEIAALNLDRVTVEDKIYVNGQDIRGDQRFLTNPLARPRVKVDAEVMATAIQEGSHQTRHYRCIRVEDWSGELVLSIFLRFSKLSHNLFVEASYFLLTPVKEKYHSVDTMGAKPSFRKFAEFFVYSAVVSTFLLVWAVFSIFTKLQHKLTRWSEKREERKTILENPSFDYGASFSIRQWASSESYRRYFQMLDKEMYLKVLEKNILDSVVSFLEERNVDVSDLKQRQTTILNNGVMISGGSLSADSLAVGQGARSVAGKVTQMASKAMTTATGNR